MRALFDTTPLRLLAVFSLFFILLVLFIKIQRYEHLTALAGFGCLNNEVCLAKLNEHTLPKNTFVYNSGGYDGQFYYYIAYSIYTGANISLDESPLRLSRIVYPLLTGWPSLFDSKKGIIYAMFIVPLFFHFLAGFMLFRFISFRSSSKNNWFSKYLSVIVYLVNPFSLSCFLLFVADALALSLLTFGFVLFFYYRITRKTRTLVLSLFFVTLAILTKEICLISLPFFAFFIIKDNFHLRQALTRLLFMIFPVFVLFLWWQKIAYEPIGLFENHAGTPFSGMIEYLLNPDALFSGRSLFVLIVILCLALTIILIVDFYKTKKINEARIAAIILIVGSMIFISFATYEEYWQNYANIIRFGMLLVLGLSLATIDAQSKGLVQRFTIGALIVFIIWDMWIFRDVLNTKLLSGFLI